MAQDDLVIANQSFPATRADINANLQAQGSNQSGASAPGTTYAYQFWADTTNGVLKQRDASNAAWVIRDTLSDDRVVTKTSGYTVVLGDMKKTILASASGGAFTVTLPAAATAGDGFEVTIKKTDSTTNAVTIDGNSSETIDGALTVVMDNQYDAVTLVCDGSNWHRKNRQFGVRNVPGGRLTLSSGNPVMNATAAAQSTVYYAPYIHDQIQIYDGNEFLPHVFTQLSLALDSDSGHTGYQQSGKNFDLFVFNDSGTLRLGTGPAWSSDTARGTGAGTTELERKNGIWTNKVSITLRFGSSAGNTVAVSANQATYVGTMRATADGQTGMTFMPAGSAGGNNTILGLYNAYNRVPIKGESRDSTTNYNYTTGSWRSLNNSTSNRVSWIDGLQESVVNGEMALGIQTSSTSVTGSSGIALDSTSSPSGFSCPVVSPSSSVGAISYTRLNSTPLLGFHYMQGMEFGATTVTFYTNAGGYAQFLSVSLMM